LSASARAEVQREKLVAQTKLGRLLNRGALTHMATGWEEALPRALELGRHHTEQTGARAYDLFHVAAALALDAKVFFTTDERQMRIARAEGLEVVFTDPGQPR
jgi:predicted nucleic acid-binding protein